MMGHSTKTGFIPQIETRKIAAAITMNAISKTRQTA